MLRITTAALVLTALAAAAALRPTQEMPQATPQHAQLLEGVGEWKGTLTMVSPGSPEEGMPCSETVTAIGEFWTTSSFECDFMGMPFVGSAVTGYDPDQKKFVGTWIDSMTTRLTVMEGTWDETRKALVMGYIGPDPMTGEMVPHRIETVHRDDAYTSTFFVGEGGGSKTMVLDMKRAE